jgi:hypothetical protein
VYGYAMEGLLCKRSTSSSGVTAKSRTEPIYRLDRCKLVKSASYGPELIRTNASTTFVAQVTAKPLCSSTSAMATRTASSSFTSSTTGIRHYPSGVVSAQPGGTLVAFLAYGFDDESLALRRMRQNRNVRSIEKAVAAALERGLDPSRAAGSYSGKTV